MTDTTSKAPDSKAPEITPPRREPAARPASVGFGEAFGLVRERWRFVAVPTVAALALSVTFVQLVTPKYTGEAKILLESRDNAFTRPNQAGNEQPQLIDEQAVASQVQVAMSRDVAREAIRRLDLVGNAEFDPLVGGMGPVRRVLMMVGLAPNLLDRPPEERVQERFFDRLAVYPAGKSRILTFDFRSQDPQLAARGANVVADVYLASLEAAKIDTARSASTWLGGNIDGLRTKVAEAEAKVEAFRARSGLFAGGGNVNLPIGAQQLSELSTQLSQARTAQADASAKAKLIKSMIKDGRAFEIPDVANNELIRRLVEQRITLRAQIALEARTLLPGHPRMKELNAQLADMETQVKGAAERVARTLENDSTIAGARIESLQAAIDAQKSVVARSNGSEVELRALEREAKAQRDQLESYLARYREASARDADKAIPADARIVQRASVPDLPSFPKKLPTVLLATLAAFVLSAGTLVARRLLATPDGEPEGEAPARQASSDEAEPARRRPVLAPAAAAMGAVVAMPAAASPASEPPVEPPAAVAAAPLRGALDLEPAAAAYDFAALVERLQAVPAAEGTGRRVLVAGLGEAGLDTLTPELAGMLARDGRAVVLSLDDSDAGFGLTDLVAGEAGFADIIAPVPGSSLHRVSRGEHDAGVLVAEPQAVEIALDAFDATYDWVVCRLDRADAAPDLVAMMAAAMDAIVIASNAPADDPALVALYGAAIRAGAPEVVVAHEGASPAARAA